MQILRRKMFRLYKLKIYIVLGTKITSLFVVIYWYEMS